MKIIDFLSYESKMSFQLMETPKFIIDIAKQDKR